MKFRVLIGVVLAIGSFAGCFRSTVSKGTAALQGPAPSDPADTQQLSEGSYISKLADASPGQEFADVPSSNPHYADIMRFKREGITRGCGANPPLFCPKAEISRGEFAVFVVRALEGENFVTPPNQFFTDVPTDHMFYRYIQELKRLKITSGCAIDRFCPDDKIPRGQALVLAICAIYGSDFEWKPIVNFSDMPSTDPFYPYVMKAVELGIEPGCIPGVKLCNDQKVLREEMASYLVKVVLPSGRTNFASSPFTQFKGGVNHVAGNYAFTNQNFLVEGASATRSLGSDSIAIYLGPTYASTYPDQGSGQWPATAPTSLVELIQTPPYQAVLKMPFKTFSIWAFSFSTAYRELSPNKLANLQELEKKEIHDLARYLLTRFQGSGKTFILKNWESDNFGLQGAPQTNDLSAQTIQDLTEWFTARQAGVDLAREELGYPNDVWVYHAIEVNLVRDAMTAGKKRTLNSIVPIVKPDMIAYSSYDSIFAAGTTSASAVSSITTQSLNYIDSLTPDPRGLGKRRIYISEYGEAEIVYPSATFFRSVGLLQAASQFGASSAYVWQLYSNECKDGTGAVIYRAGIPIGDPTRPVASSCPGWWLIKPDGTQSGLVSILQNQYFH